jgi:hypothetical protein
MSGSKIKEQMAAYDALPYYDQEYNHPSVQNEVLRLIEEEMKSFSPPEGDYPYLDALPYPKLRFSNAPGFQKEYERILATSNGAKVGDEEARGIFRMDNEMDMDRYAVPGPGKDSNKDRGAVLRSLNNAKAQYEHQLTRVANLEHSTDDNEDGGNSEEYASSVEKMAMQLQQHLLDVNQQRNKVNMDRMTTQRDAHAAIVKVTGKRDQALQRVHHLQAVVEELKAAKKARTYQN